MRPPVTATYRVQLTPDFGFEAAAAIVPYLARLGVSHLYTSPLEEATPGSTHGYDVTDHSKVRDELGGAEGLRRLWEVLDAHGMGQVVDIVPNHMGIRHPSNRWWQDVLRHGPTSAHAQHFDVDWTPPDPASAGKVVLPFLGTSLEEALAERAFAVEPDGAGGLTVVHHDDRWPASDDSLAVLGVPLDDEGLLGAALGRLAADPVAMGAFLERQHWRPVHWRRAGELLNWRRFFDVTDLASVRVERPEVFADVHALLREWFADDLAARVVQGVRVDHVDGLVDPEGYLVRLRELVGPDRLLVVEKILAAEEAMPATWPVDGTSGYEVITRIDEAVTEPDGSARLRARAEAFTGDATPWAEVELESKRLVAARLLPPEVARLGRCFAGALDHLGRGAEAGAAPEVVAELAAELAVYRTYPAPEGREHTEADRRAVADAVAGVGAHRPDLPADLVALAGELVLGEVDAGPAGEELAVRFGQVTAPLAAKAVEDTAFYRAVQVPWVNEVGGDPGRLDVPLDAVDDALAELARAWPGTLCPLTTHDTKRSADVRARLSRLAGCPDRIADAVARWHEQAAPHRSAEGPDPTTEWLLWLTLLGAWPIDGERMAAYATKAMKEAKVHTSWTDPDEAFEDAVQAFLAGVLDDDDLRGALAGAAAEVRAEGRATSLAQVVLAATAVGSPDLYQGDEVWNLALVDPDNRRPVDHARLAALLDEVADPAFDVAARWAGAADDEADDGAVKLALWHRLLALRAARPDAFAAPYAPLPTDGPGARRHLAYRRGDDVAVVVPVRPGGPLEGWTVTLPDGTWTDAVTGATWSGGAVAVPELVAALPVAVLVRG